MRTTRLSRSTLAALWALLLVVIPVPAAASEPVVVSVPTSAAFTNLPEGAGAQLAGRSTTVSSLGPGQWIASADGRYRLVMQGDGNLVVYGPSGVVWSSGTWGHPGSVMVLQDDGNLVVHGSSGVVWSSGTWGHPGSVLVLQDDGNLVVHLGGRPLWSVYTGPRYHTLFAGEVLRAGEQRISLDHRRRVVMQGDGNLVVYGPGPLWHTGTNGSGEFATVQSDGNLVVYGGGAARWHSRTVAGGDSRLVLQDDGNLVLSSGGTIRWSSATGQYMDGPRQAGLDAATRTRMTPGTWRPGCPVGLDDLVLLELPYRDYDGWARRGSLIVHRDSAGSLGSVMTAAASGGFMVHRIDVADVTGGNDRELMRRNITSAFNCRFVSGTTRWSKHAYGRAIDVNPLVNPWVGADGTVSPPEGTYYANRNVSAPGMLYPGRPPVTTFLNAGWRWGGNWVGEKDYQHFDR